MGKMQSIPRIISFILLFVVNNDLGLLIPYICDIQPVETGLEVGVPGPGHGLPIGLEKTEFLNEFGH